jgi:maltooligosyltrehalose trehalohydrolase
MTSSFPWWYPVGAQIQKDGTSFRVWADSRKKVSVVLNKREYPLNSEGNGYFQNHVPDAKDGKLYTFLLDGEGPFSDPASRFQPRGPHGPSQIVDPDKFSWTDQAWPGVQLPSQVIYELHVGTFTPEGTWQSAIRELPRLAELGITVLEVMPICEFQGSYGWGYDGVNLFAPTRNYGSPDDFRSFVDATHANNLAVILDVVYNHLGPDGNYLPSFSKHYFTEDHKTDWGAAINYYSKNSAPVREFFSSNAAYWIKEYHLDGLRLDATQDIYDKSKDHIIAELTRNARKAAGSRSIIIVGENEPQDTTLIRLPCKGGYGIDALWNDDFHHSATVAATGKRGAYYIDYLGAPQELLSSLKYGFLYQGQWYSWQRQRRGTSTFDTNPAAMIAFLQNHDQVANSARGQRLHELTTLGRLKALTAVTLLGPATPMLFQGQEFASSAPFLYFADHKPELAQLVREGRAEFLAQWRNLALGQLKYNDPCSRQTFEKCKLNLAEREKNKHIYALHKDLLALRKSEPVFSRQNRQFDGAIVGPEAFVVRFFSDNYQDDRLLVVNLGTDLNLSPSPVPLLGHSADTEWTILWSSEDPAYGGGGTAPLDSDLNWTIPGHAAVVLKPALKKGWIARS